jgi:hypothetical protein
MFIATMFSYGKDHECVGVDGIKSCMGVFLNYNDAMLYAIHAPHNGENVLTQGRTQFVNYVRQQIVNYDPTRAQIVVVLNGGNRAKAGDEITEYCRLLQVNQATLYRVRKHIPILLMNDPASVAVIYQVYTDQFRTWRKVKYQRARESIWTTNGSARDGFYNTPMYTKQYYAPTAAGHGWYEADDDNSDIEVKQFNF